MSTPFQIVLRTLGYFTVCKTAEEYLEAEAGAGHRDRRNAARAAAEGQVLTGKLPRLTDKLP